MKKNKAFTLAEVLITLAIIGVVAALTISATIKHYQKQVTATRLKMAYSLVSNAFNNSIAYNGSLNFTQYRGTKNRTYEIIDTYLIPYLKHHSYEYKTFEELGYPNGITYPNGQTHWSKTVRTRMITLMNGMTIFPTSVSLPKTNGEYVTYAMVLCVDVNGRQGPNVFGKDVFQFAQYLFKDVQLVVRGEYKGFKTYRNSYDIVNDPNKYKEKYGTLFNKDTGEAFFTKVRNSREEMMTECSMGDSNTQFCGSLIKNDGWYISDDYPWIK